MLCKINGQVHRKVGGDLRAVASLLPFLAQNGQFLPSTLDSSLCATFGNLTVATLTLQAFLWLLCAEMLLWKTRLHFQL